MKISRSKSFGQSIAPLTNLKINVITSQRSGRHKPFNESAVFIRKNSQNLFSAESNLLIQFIIDEADRTT